MQEWDRKHTRRDFIKLAAIPITAAFTPFIPDREMPKEIDLTTYKANAIAHNAAIHPDTLSRALESSIQYIEVDLTVVDGQLVVAHSPEEYLQLSEHIKAHQQPEHVLRMIGDAGKVPFFDFKDEIEDFSQVAKIREYASPAAMASSNNHILLNDLRRSGFEGKILFTLGDESTLNNFMQANKGRDLSKGNYGVSIRHTLLPDVAVNLKDMGMTIAAWSPLNNSAIAQAIDNGADFVTSDDFDALGLLRR